MTLGYHGDVWPATASHPQPHRKSLRSQSDELLTSQLESELEGSDIDASGVEVKVVGGAVQLEGAVADARAMRTAVEIAEKLLGVESVYNGLQVTQKQ
jgi:osmotically-inducible protein OsmY